MAATSLPPGLHDVFYLILSHLAPKAPAAGGSDSNITSLDDTRDLRAAQKDLARLARSHPSFTRPAVAVLWRSLPSQKPLEHLLCVVGIAEGSPAGRRDVQRLEMCRTPATHRSGWMRFQEYASLVREIVIDPITDTHADPLQDTFWNRLSSLHPTLLLPRLERAAIRCSKISRSIDAGVLRLLNPSLRELDIRVVSPHATLSGHLQLEKALATCFLSIKSLEVLSIEAPNLARIVDVQSLPRSHPRLRYLKLNDRASSVEPSLRALASLANLKYLHLNLCHSELVMAPLRNPVTLTGLGTLAVSCYELAAISNLLDHVKVPRLQTFSICKLHRDSNTVPLASQELSRHLSTLVAKCPSLTSFEWGTGRMQVGPTTARRVGQLGQGDRRSGASLAEVFAPLLSHRGMRRFSARSSEGYAVSYTLADFRAVAEAWPDLETLRLPDYDDDSKRTGTAGSSASSQRARPPLCTDLEAVFVLAHQCPRLRVLHIGRMRFVPGAFGSNLARCPSAPHPGVREFRVDRVLCAGGQQRCGDEEVRRRKAVLQLRYLMAEAFPSAVIQMGGLEEPEDKWQSLS